MIAVVGGTGRLGRLVAERLVAAGEPVRVIARSEPGDPVPSARFVAADVRDLGTLAPAIAGADVVVSAVHGMDPSSGQSPRAVDRDGNLNLIRAARGVGAHVVLVSVIGATPDHRMELHRMKGEAEQALRAGPADWTIVRAAAFAELWADVLRQAGGSSGVPRVFGRGTNPINFVSVHDVAAAVSRAATDPSLRGAVIEVGGPENLTMTEFASRLTPDRRPPGHVPRAALQAMALVAAPIWPARARLARQALAMDVTDLAFDPGASRAAYPWLPCTAVEAPILGPP
jgi:NADH dehydrogenase